MLWIRHKNEQQWGRVFFSSCISMKGPTWICINLFSRHICTTLFWSHLSILSIHMVYSLKKRDISPFLPFLFSVCTYLMRQNKEADIKVLHRYVTYLGSAGGPTDETSFWFLCIHGQDNGCPYDRQFRFTMNLHVSFHSLGRSNSTWQSMEIVSH